MKKKLRIILIILLVLLTIPVIISTNYESPIKLLINDQEYIIYKDTEEINLKEYNTYDNLLIIKKTLKTNTKLDNQKLKYNKLTNLSRQEIDKNNKHTLEIKYITGKKRTITINILPSTFPNIDIEGNSKFVGDYYLTTINDSTIFNYQMIINEQGKITYYKQTETPTYDFQKNNNNYTYIQDNRLIILDNNFKQINTISNVHKYLYINENEIITYYNNTLKYYKDNNIIWELEKELNDIVLDNDNNILLVYNNKIEKIKLEDTKLLWKLNNKKGKFKLKEKISNIKTIIPISNSKYIIITNNKEINIELNHKKKKIKKYTTKKIKYNDLLLVDKESNTFITTTTKDNKTTIIEKSPYLTIETYSKLSKITKK